MTGKSSADETILIYSIVQKNCIIIVLSIRFVLCVFFNLSIHYTDDWGDSEDFHFI